MANFRSSVHGELHFVHNTTELDSTYYIFAYISEVIAGCNSDDALQRPRAGEIVYVAACEKRK